MTSFRFKRLSISACLTYIFLSFQGMGQNIVPPDNPNDTSRRFPITSWYDYNRTQILFKNSELGFTNKRILSLGFYVQSRGNNVKNSAVRIRIKTTSDTVVGPISYVETITGTTEVFSGLVSQDSIVAGRWVHLKLQTPFDYSGTGNLMILVESDRDVQGNNDGDDNSKRFRFSATQVPRFQKWWSDHFEPTGPGVVENVRPNVLFSVTEIPSPCTGTPEGGIAEVDNGVFPCTGGIIHLSLSGFSQNLGIQLQWQRQTPGSSGNWVDIPGAGFENLTQTVTGSALYRCRVTCLAGNQSVYSTPVQVQVTAPPFAVPASEGFTGLIQTEGQSFPLGCGFLSQNISGPRGWRGTIGRNPDQPRFRGVAGRTDSAAIYSGWASESYFYLPSMVLSPDSVYTLSFWYKHSRYGDNNEGPSFDIRVGNLPEASSQTLLLLSKENQNDTLFQEATASFHPETAGLYSFSIRNKTFSGNPYFLVVDDIQVSKSVFVGLQAENKNGRILVFPNPCQGSFRVFLPTGFREGNLELTGLKGNNVGHFRITENQPMELKGLLPGIYILRVRNRESVFTGKLVVE